MHLTLDTWRCHATVALQGLAHPITRPKFLDATYQLIQVSMRQSNKRIAVERFAVLDFHRCLATARLQSDVATQFPVNDRSSRSHSSVLAPIRPKAFSGAQGASQISPRPDVSLHARGVTTLREDPKSHEAHRLGNLLVAKTQQQLW